MAAPCVTVQHYHSTTDFILCAAPFTPVTYLFHDFRRPILSPPCPLASSSLFYGFMDLILFGHLFLLFSEVPRVSESMWSESVARIAIQHTVQEHSGCSEWQSESLFFHVASSLCLKSSPSHVLWAGGEGTDSFHFARETAHSP